MNPSSIPEVEHERKSVPTLSNRHTSEAGYCCPQVITLVNRPLFSASEARGVLTLRVERVWLRAIPINCAAFGSPACGQMRSAATFDRIWAYQKGALWPRRLIPSTGSSTAPCRPR